jgi:uncharacterized protein YkwD
MSLAAATALTAMAVLTAAPTSAAPEDCAYMGFGSGPDSLGLQFDPQEQGLFDAINAYRASNGVAALAPSDALRRPAMWASLDSVSTLGKAAPGHIDSRGMNMQQRVQHCSGYTGRLAEINYEHRGGSYGNSVQPALDWWKQSPTHNAIILDPNYTTAAVGLAYNGVDAEILYVWTVVFGDH